MKPRALLGLAGGAAAAAVYALAVRPWHLRWGATDEEVRMPFPGQEPDEPTPPVSATHAITIHAPTSEVWAWLVQIGQDRGGFYSYAWIENLLGCRLRNADRIVPEWQSLRLGDSVRLHPHAPPLPVSHVEPGKALVLAGGWGFVLQEMDPGTTRLIARGWGDDVPQIRHPLLHFLYWRGLFEPAHFVMERKMLLGIRARAEAQAARERRSDGQPGSVACPPTEEGGTAAPLPPQAGSEVKPLPGPLEDH